MNGSLGAAGPTAPARLVLLGIDAASPTLLEAWAADGTMPNLQALIDRGLVGKTRGVDGFFIGSTWPSFYTGTNPARHGVHYLRQIVPGTYRLHRCSEGEFVRRPSFWEVLSRAGQRVAVLDVPLSRVDPTLNGIQVVEWGGHDSLYGLRTSPAELASQLISAFGEHPGGGTCDGGRRSADDYRAFASRLAEGALRKADLTRTLLQLGGWDLLIQVFTEAHCAGHQCWHLHDSNHPAHDREMAAATGNPLRQVYSAIDDALGRVLAAAGDAHVAVFTAHGMSYRYGTPFLLRKILLRLGVTALPPDESRPSAFGAVGGVLRRVFHRAPGAVQRLVRALRRRLMPRQRPAPERTRIAIDAARSLCFPVENGLAVGGIRLNLAGREPEGVLEPGEQAHAFCERLTADLLEIVDERNGEPLIRRVMRTADLYSGDYLDHLPDLLVDWSDAVRIGSTALGVGAGAMVRAHSPKIGSVEGSNDYGRSGEHRPGGWFAIAGPDVTPGRLDYEPSLLDLAPTFAAMLGTELPGCDGRPILELARAVA